MQESQPAYLWRVRVLLDISHVATNMISLHAIAKQGLAHHCSRRIVRKITVFGPVSHPIGNAFALELPSDCDKRILTSWITTWLSNFIKIRDPV